MNNSPFSNAVLILGREPSTYLDKYANRQAARLGRTLPGQLALEQQNSWKERLSNLTDSLNSFYESDEVRKTWLVLGKVQSGKTSHLLGTIAYASDSGIALSTVFTGTNETLNKQFMKRAASDLSAGCVQIFEVPTSPSSQKFNSLLDDVTTAIQLREQLRLSPTGLTAPMPLLVTMKRPSRVRTLKVLIEKLLEVVDFEMKYLMIDDEADQASQNTKAKKEEVAATYGAIASIRKLEIKHALLAYTATPQAVLLAQKTGALRPDRCVTVPPRLGYFGLEEIVQEPYRKNICLVNDIELDSKNRPKNPSLWLAEPASLKNAVLHFFLVALIRNTVPEYFYKNSELPYSQLSSPAQSTQMLIHQSTKQLEHSSMHEWIKKIVDSIRVDCLDATNKNYVPDYFQAAWKKLLKISGAAEMLPDRLDSDAVRLLWGITSNVGLKIVNSDTDNATISQDMPLEDSDWEAKSCWILIGGEILGRGLTIPQLTTTYFLRNATKPNFDTVSQQMRFCGYRSAYSHVTTIWAPEENTKRFEYMSVVEDVVWRYAKRWDRFQTPLTGVKMPPIMYAAPLSAGFAATRANVKDPNIKDIRINKDKEILVSPRKIFNPFHTYSNLHLLHDWISEIKSQFQVENGWHKITDIKSNKFSQLVSPWLAGSSQAPDLRSIGELFTQEMGELGLSDQVISVFIKSELLLTDILEHPLTLLEGSPTRATLENADAIKLNGWARFYLPTGNSKVWPELSSGHVGDSQRLLKNSLPHDGTVLIIEPLQGHKHGDQGTKLAFGLGFTIFKPKEYEVQVMEI